MAGRQVPAHDEALFPAQDSNDRLEPGAATIALFDLDRTLLPGSSLVALGRRLVAEGLVSRRTMLAAAARDTRFRIRGSSDGQVTRIREKALSAVAGLERAPLVDLAKTVADRLADQARPGVRLLLDRHLAAGDFCVVLSASPQELVEAVCARLGAHRGIGTRGEVADGRFTGRLDGPFCYGAGKLERLRSALGPVDLGTAWAYADSSSDVPVLAASGHPVAINPDRALTRIATANGWTVVRFAHH